MSVIGATILGFGFLYAGLIISMRIGWRNLKNFQVDKARTIQPETSISIVIAARNEENNIVKCLNDLLQQDYALHKYEIIVVDDHSNDATAQCVHNFMKKHPNVKLIKLANINTNVLGKKAAITAGVEESAGELIITTDADCSFDDQWLKSFAIYYEQYQPAMIAGPVCFLPQRNVFGKFLELEFISLIAASAGALGMKYPLMCNGANLAFRRELFIELNAFENNNKWASGDDMFLMHGIRKRYGNAAIHFLKSRDAIVETLAPASFQELIMQRVRWGSKTRAYVNTPAAIVAMIVFINAMMITGATALLFFYPALGLPLAAAWMLKLCSDFLLLYPVSSFFGRRQLLMWFIPFQLLHLLYISGTGLLANISGYKWKGRKH